MAPHTRAELLVEIIKLRKQQLESFADGTFRGWTVEKEVEHRDRAERLEGLVFELSLLDGINPSSA
jgi:hypothetical protein